MSVQVSLIDTLMALIEYIEGRTGASKGVSHRSTAGIVHCRLELGRVSVKVRLIDILKEEV